MPDTTYLASPVKGRVARSRQVEPVRFTIAGPHSEEKIKKAVLDAFYKYCYHGYAVVYFKDYVSMQMLVDIHRAHDHERIATITIDEIEE